MSVSNSWRNRRRVAIDHLVEATSVLVIYLASEVIIWCLSLLLASVSLQYFSSILGMLLIFGAMTAGSHLDPCCDWIYRQWVKSKVDFINANLGLGFSVPIIMMNHALSGRDGLGIIGTFAVFCCGLLVLLGAVGLWSYQRTPNSRPTSNHESPISSGEVSKETIGLPTEKSSDVRDSSLESATQWSTGGEPERTEQRVGNDTANFGDSPGRIPKGWWYFGQTYGYTLLSLCGIAIIGIPVVIITADARALDGFTLWFFWILSVRLQKWLKGSSAIEINGSFKHVFTTLMNPVLLTTLLMFGYTRAMAAMTPHDGLAHILKRFRSGTPLYTLWTAAVSHTPVATNPSGWFGAGDLALSLLECGILTWGFKLYECRQQLFSLPGVVVSIFCVGVAAGNVLLSVLMANIIGLDQPQSLAFAARSTTLALAKPAITALGGDLALNATLVVSNGILGQLMYPFLLGRLPTSVASRPEATSQQREGLEHSKGNEDDLVTIAAGTAIGVNGAAMGVSYLYETNSNAAPYAALSMTVFGVMTVVFTTIEPFKSLVCSLTTK